jgi:hypothetical protein
MISTIMVGFEQEEHVLDVLAGVSASLDCYPESSELIFVDNSLRPMLEVYRFLQNLPIPTTYEWQQGNNLLNAPGANRAIQLCHGDLGVYLCTRHGRMLNPTWVVDLLKPLQDSDEVGLTGDWRTDGVGPGSWVWANMKHTPYYASPYIHGGIMGFRPELCRQSPYPQEFPNWGADICRTALTHAAKKVCIAVPSIRSSYLPVGTNLTPWKYVHSYHH